MLVQQQRESVLGRERCHADRIMSWVAWGLMGLALAIAPIYHTWREALVGGFALAASLQLLTLARPGSRLTRAWTAFVFMAFSALLIDQMHGMIEMHFSIFVLLAFLLFYSDWLPLVVGAAMIAVHHLSFHFLQEAGFPVWVFPHLCNIGIVFVHAAFVVFETVLLVYMALQRERSSLETGEVIAMLDALLADQIVDLRVQSDVETGSAGQFSRFIGFLRCMVKEIVQHSKEITGNGDEISHSSEAVAYASARQKQQIEHAVIAMRETQQAIADISSSNQNMAMNMSLLQDGAVGGGQVVATTIASIHKAANTVRDAALIIEELERASQSIGRIVETINEIAEQTNLLALNASIEAARAGESGRGFSVVAGEVRRLAERTSHATKEIGETITSIQNKTGDALESMRSGKEKFTNAVNTAENAGVAIQKIIEAAKSQTLMVEKIAGASTEQKAVTDRVSEIMNEIANMAERSSAESAESAKACVALKDRATELHQMLSQFRTDTEDVPTNGAGINLSRSKKGATATIAPEHLLA